MANGWHSNAPRGQDWTRRALLSWAALLPLRAESVKGRLLPSQRSRYLDPSTDFLLYRLTDPSYASYLPARHSRVASRRDSFLLFSSERTGSLQAFRMDQRTGDWEQLTQAEALDPSSLVLMPDESSFCYFDSSSLRQVILATLREKEVYRTPDGWTRAPGLTVSPDGSRAAVIESRPGTFRLRLIKLRRGAAATPVEGSAALSDPVPQPRRERILYRQGANSLFVVSYDGRQKRPLPLAPGGVGPAFWSPDGRTLLYLHYPEEKGKLHSIREYSLDASSDQLLAPTSQFVDFQTNANATVFVGASENLASPYVLLLLRSTRRELTLCEHGASDPSRVAPVFSPDSQRIYFQSDRHGRPAIYCIPVDKLVEPT